MTVRYAHTNIVAHDYERLASFYARVFHCKPVPPARDISDPWLSRGSGVPEARLRGMHLRLPGHGTTGPTLEIFQYDSELQRAMPIAANRCGYGHIAFQVDDVSAVLAEVVAAGGASVGECVTADVAGAGKITFVYVADPEGNIIELQHWHTSS